VTEKREAIQGQPQSVFIHFITQLRFLRDFSRACQNFSEIPEDISSIFMKSALQMMEHFDFQILYAEGQRIRLTFA
jgi:hypothetical protein